MLFEFQNTSTKYSENLKRHKLKQLDVTILLKELLRIGKNSNNYQAVSMKPLQKTPKLARDYIESGSDAEHTLKHNLTYFDSISIIPRIFCNNSYAPVPQCQIFNRPVNFIGIAPFASQATIHPNGELETAKAAQALGMVMILSTYSTIQMEVVKAYVDRLWLQLYIFDDFDMTLDLVRRAELIGVEALVITVDRPLLGKRRCNITNKYSLPPHLRYANFDKEIKSSSDRQGLQIVTNGDMPMKSVTWDIVSKLREITKMKIILKGIMTVADIHLAVDYNIDAIYISNHGGRQLDDVPHALQILKQIKMKSKIPIFVDGGFRTGADVFKAKQFGADMVFLGRIVSYALENGSEAIIKSMVDVQEEFDFCKTIADTSSKL